MAFDLSVNRTVHRVDADAQTPLLWVIREHLGLTGTKFSCGAGLCGSCTVLIDDEPIRSCITLVENVTGKAITTIEGLSRDGTHPVQRAWSELDAGVEREQREPRPDGDGAEGDEHETARLAADDLSLVHWNSSSPRAGATPARCRR